MRGVDERGCGLLSAFTKIAGSVFAVFDELRGWHPGRLDGVRSWPQASCRPRADRFTYGWDGDLAASVSRFRFPSFLGLEAETPSGVNAVLFRRGGWPSPRQAPRMLPCRIARGAGPRPSNKLGGIRPPLIR